MAFKGWSYVLVGVVLKLTLLQSKNGTAFTTMMSVCLLSLVLGGLCQLVHFFRYWNFTHTLQTFLYSKEVKSFSRIENSPYSLQRCYEVHLPFILQLHFLANLTQSTHPLFCSKDQPTTTPKAERLKGPTSAAAVMMFKSKRPYFLTFYVKDNRLHLLLPMVFFLGLFEAFMSKNFLMVSISIFFIQKKRKGSGIK